MMRNRQAGAEIISEDSAGKASNSGSKPTNSQLRYLKSGLDQPGGKLPLFDQFGQAISQKTIRSCI